METPEHMEKMEKAGLACKIMMGDENEKYIMSLQERVKMLVKEAREAR